MHEKEQRIKEQRLIEATRKGLTGMDGKFGCILRNLGHPILGQGSAGGMYQSTPYRDEFWDDYEATADGIGEADIDEAVIQDGLHFDGLSRGMHLEILYKENAKQLTVTYKGFLVYSEVEGDLDCYVPAREWEDLIERLYVLAKKIEKNTIREVREEESQEDERQRWDFLARLRSRWGL